MYIFAQNRVQKYSGAVATRPRAGFGRVIGRGGPNLVLTQVVTAPNQPPRYVIVILGVCFYSEQPSGRLKYSRPYLYHHLLNNTMASSKLNNAASIISDLSSARSSVLVPTSLYLNGKRV